MITIPSALNFSELNSFYFFFKSFTNLNILITFARNISKNELLFLSRAYKLPFKNT